jgi:hypothetical protein
MAALQSTGHCLIMPPQAQTIILRLIHLCHHLHMRAIWVVETRQQAAEQGAAVREDHVEVMSFLARTEGI